MAGLVGRGGLIFYMVGTREISLETMDPDD